jgi:hypothetical protein
MMYVPIRQEFTHEQIANEMMSICGCKGQHNCNCTSVQNMAIGNLYYRKNSGDQDYGKDQWHCAQIARIRREQEAYRLTAPPKCGKIPTMKDPSDDPGYVKMPQTADEAVGMVLIGMEWLRVNAPDRLKVRGRENENG